MAIKVQESRSGKGKAILCIFIVLAAIVVAGICIVTGDSRGVSLSEDRTVKIEQGWGESTVAQELSKEGIIKYPLVFRLQSRLGGYADQFQPGNITVKDGMSYTDILNEITTANRDTVTVVIPEGYDARQIAEALSEAGLECAADFMSSLDPSLYDYAFLHGLPRRSGGVEGYLFPATYEIPESYSAAEVVNLMLKSFDSVFVKEYYDRAEQMGMSVDDIITMASIVERETNSNSERAKVAGVFYNRLNSGMKLQSCATVQYVLGERKPILSIADTKINSPYNTYVYAGLPVGPICNPGEECIRAALYPEETDAYYFCLSASGEHIFSTNFEDHVKAMETMDLTVNVDTSAVENEDSKK